MLSLSTRSRYGVRLMVALALNWGKGTTLLKEISRREDISEKYLSQIVIPLKAAGLVVSQRGFRGGYALARPPEGITVREVVEAIEGPIVPVPCTADDGDDGGASCGRATTCAAAAVWRKLRTAIETSLSSFTLADLARQARRVGAASDSYSI
ncbi:MAG: Rrf2 family transcriptional regulator [Spirochaetes bacterium]|nr:Rrf2 family transcriptional regulator [Spirochaetota bacterium]